MANTATVYARIDPVLKEEVEKILAELGMTPSSLIQMLYSEIRLTRRVPLHLALPKKPICIEDMTDEEVDQMLKKSEQEIATGQTYSLEEVGEMLGIHAR